MRFGNGVGHRGARRLSPFISLLFPAARCVPCRGRRRDVAVGGPCWAAVRDEQLTAEAAGGKRCVSAYNGGAVPQGSPKEHERRACC